MSRQLNPTTPLRHIPTAYDGRGLGRDDPVWPLYLKEAEKWDAELADGWNKSMDVLIVFAALFSAIVTAFVIESYKSLQPDTAAITAAATIQIVQILQQGAIGQLPSLPDQNNATFLAFQPTATAVLVNVTWFLSLSLSVSVTLIAVLVKQWSERFVSGRLGPPCVQARTRQARYDKLEFCRAEDIVLALPGIMHASLGLFLVGLVIFLQDLNHVVFIPVLAVVLLAATLYAVATFMPLVIPFCPYSTPLSSRTLLGAFCHIFGIGDSEDGHYLSPSQRKEKRISENSTPDKVTGNALDWLIRHSEKKDHIDMAIRGIASARLEEPVWRLLAQEPLMLLVAQHFTAFFNGILEHENNQQLKIELDAEDERLRVASLYGRTLANLASHSANDPAKRPNQLALTEENFGFGVVSDSGFEQSKAVERGLYYLSRSPSPEMAAFGIANLSTWYDFSTRQNQTRLKWKEMLIRLSTIVVEHLENKYRISSDAFSALTTALPVEVSYWRRDLDKKDRKEVMEPLIKLLQIHPLPKPLYTGISLALAVLAMTINDYPHPSMQIPPEYRTMNAAEQRSRRARDLASHYSRDIGLQDRDADTLLLFGLSGLADSYEALGLDIEKDIHAMGIIADRLVDLSKLDGSEPIHLDPSFLPATFDIRTYTVDVLCQRFRIPRLRSEHQLPEPIRAKLLESIAQKSHLWSDHGGQLALPIVQMLKTAETHELQKQCLIALGEHWLAGPSLLHWQILFSYNIPYKLVSIVQTDPELRSRARSNFEQLTLELGKDQSGLNEPALSLTGVLRRLIQKDLFDTLVSSILCEMPRTPVEVWKHAIVEFPNSLHPDTSNEDREIMQKLRRYYNSPHTGSMMMLFEDLKRNLHG